MDPRHHSFIQDGPDCVCGHARVDHVGVHPRYSLTVWDLSCQVEGCTNCPGGYRPLGPLSLSDLQVADQQLMAAEHAARRKQLRRLRAKALAAMAASALLSVLAGVVNAQDATVLAAVLAAASVVALVAYVMLIIQTVLQLEPPHLLMTLATLLPVPPLVLPTLNHFLPLPDELIIGTAVACLSLGLLAMFLDGRRSQARVARIIDNLHADLTEATAVGLTARAPVADDGPPVGGSS